jgi:hydrogenase-1 operon protein HyaE
MNFGDPLLDRLVKRFDCHVVTADSLDAFLARSGDSVLFCGGNPAQYPESLDVAVILPELQAAFAGRFRIAIAERALEPVLQARYGLQRWPSLLFLRGGSYLGVIAGMQDWSTYLMRIAGLLQCALPRPPSPGIAASHGAGHRR